MDEGQAITLIRTSVDRGRADGTSRLYRMNAKLEHVTKRLWQVVREQLADSPATAQDAQRVRSVLAKRQTKSQEFFSSAAGQWDAMRAELFGDRTDLLALLALLDPTWTVGDLGCGTGHVSASLAPFVKQVIAIDSSKAMLSAARRAPPARRVRQRRSPCRYHRGTTIR